MDNFVHVADSFRKPRRRSPRENLRVQNYDGRNHLRDKDKLAIDFADSFVELADVHDLAAEIDRRNRKTFVAAEKNRSAGSRIGNDDDDSNSLRADAA